MGKTLIMQQKSENTFFLDFLTLTKLSLSRQLPTNATLNDQNLSRIYLFIYGYWSPPSSCGVAQNSPVLGVGTMRPIQDVLTTLRTVTLSHGPIPCPT